MRESDLLKLVKDFLTLHRVLWWRENVAGIRMTYKGKQRFFRAGRPGLPDIICLHKGRCIGFELKGEKNEQSQAQKQFESDFTAAGGVYVLARRIEEVEAALR